jgi:hypothetical protein
MKPESPNAFVQLIKSASYEDKELGALVPLTNVTFFLGAGFSKSWDSRYPTGYELFSMEASKYSDDLTDFIDSLGFNAKGKLNFADFKDIAYQVSMQKNTLP